MSKGERFDPWKLISAFTVFGTIGTLLALVSRPARAMTNVAEQDTTNVPKASYFNADITVPALMPPEAVSNYVAPSVANTDTASAVQYVPWEQDFPLTTNTPTPYSWEADWVAQNNPNGGDPYTAWEADFPGTDPTPPTNAPASGQYVPFEMGWVMQTPTFSPDVDRNVRAFLYMIQCCEHLFPVNVLNGACYFIFYSGNANFNSPEYLNQRFTGTSNHPAITGECLPVPLPTQVCINAGLKEGCVSTGAGAYQINRPTWNAYRNEFGVTDFSPSMQDQFAIGLLHKCGAYPFIIAGDFAGAVSKASSTWASLPGSTAKQNSKQMVFVVDRFNEGVRTS